MSTPARPALTLSLLSRIVSIMKATTKNLIKVSAVSAALAACTVMSAVCVVSTLNYQNTHDGDISQSTQHDMQGGDSTTPAPVQLNQCVDAAAINCVHLPDDQSHAYYVNVGGHRWVYDGDTPAANAGEYLGNGYYQTFNPYQAVNAAGDSIALGAKFSADMGEQLPPCATEDSDNCYWDAATMGNGEGRSFVTIDGATKYTD